MYASSAMMTVGPAMHGKVWAARVDAEWLPQRKGFCSYLVILPAPHQQEWNKFAAGPIRQNLPGRNRCRTDSLEERNRCRTDSTRNRRGKEALQELPETPCAERNRCRTDSTKLARGLEKPRTRRQAGPNSSIRKVRGGHGKKGGGFCGFWGEGGQKGQKKWPW